MIDSTREEEGSSRSPRISSTPRPPARSTRLNLRLLKPEQWKTGAEERRARAEERRHNDNRTEKKEDVTPKVESRPMRRSIQEMPAKGNRGCYKTKRKTRSMGREESETIERGRLSKRRRLNTEDNVPFLKRTGKGR